MDPEDKDSKKFGQVVDTLHSKQKLSSLRTYQGDMAEFIKEKNESVFSIAVKEKNRKEEEERAEQVEKIKKDDSIVLDNSLKSKLGKWERSEIKGDFKKKIEEKKVEHIVIPRMDFKAEPKIDEIEDIGGNLEFKVEPKIEPKVEEKPKIAFKFEPEKEIFHKPKKTGFKMNAIIIFLSLILVVGGVFAALYAFKIAKKEPVAQVVLKTEIIPYNNSVNIFGVTKENLASKISQIKPKNGITVLKIATTSEMTVEKSKDFFNLLEISLPGALMRTLKDPYTVGLFSQSDKIATFLVISVNDFGNAFSSMLDWETNMEQDLSFFNIATSTDAFVWKDVIVKNKDTRDLVNQYGKTKIAYTFLDKNTILITTDASVIGEVSSAYASRAVAR